MTPEIIPAVYEHAAALIGRSPWAVSRDENLLVEAHAAAFHRYAHRPVVVGIDIYNLEAESYGAGVDPPQGNAIPAVTRHPCRSLDDMLALPAYDPSRDGRIAMMLRAADRLHKQLPAADVRVPVSGPFSIASNLMGFEPLLMSCVMEPDKAARAIAHLAANQEVFLQAIASAGVGATLFESAATPPLLSPEMFRTIELPALKLLGERAGRILNGPVACILGGNTTPILEDLLSTGAGYVICPSETDQAAFMATMRSHPDVYVRINMDPGIVSGNDERAIAVEIKRVIALAADHSHTCLGTGVLPYETPPGNVAIMRRLLNEMLQ